VISECRGKDRYFSYFFVKAKLCAAVSTRLGDIKKPLPLVTGW
jgi:hypothetical protein